MGIFSGSSRRLIAGLLLASSLAGCMTVSQPAPPQKALQCQVDPTLRQHLTRPADPANDTARVLEVYGLRVNSLLTISEGRTDSAVKSLDDCNAANAALQKAQAPKRPWWVLWARD